MDNQTVEKPGNVQPKKTTVLVGGCFDLIHYGHVSFLKAAKDSGDYLIVALESDENVKMMKGDLRPVHTQSQRQAMLDSLKFVDEVIPLPPMHGDPVYFDFVTRLKPDVIAVTEGDPVMDKKQKQAESIGAKLIVIPKIHTPSTSQLAKLLGLE
jgi:rfaE bifunctional protein nucleotidyltransferase chain/domain